MKKKNDRRNFIKKITLAGSAAMISGKVAFSENNNENMNNVKAKNVKPLGFQWETRDPFLFCVHHEDFYPKGNDQLGPDASLEGRQIGQDFLLKDGWRMYHGRTVPGFPGHPHRGFETVTVVRKGLVDHTDSLGQAGRYGDGDVQWMTAGKGVQHAEMFPCLNSEEDNPMELFQIWLNLPSKDKFVEPHYKMLWSEDLATFEQKDTDGVSTKIEIVAGNISGSTTPTPPPNSWASNPENEVAIWNVKIEAGGKCELPLASEGINRTLYFYSGAELKVGEEIIPEYHSAEIEANAQITLEALKDDCHILILQGKPIGEHVVQHGPFVMNSREEIQQAFTDYQETQFGGWPWDSYDPVHGKTKGRFATHLNGETEIK